MIIKIWRDESYFNVEFDDSFGFMLRIELTIHVNVGHLNIKIDNSKGRRFCIFMKVKTQN
jgi:hypothetical protein